MVGISFRHNQFLSFWISLLMTPNLVRNHSAAQPAPSWSGRDRFLERLAAVEAAAVLETEAWESELRLKGKAKGGECVRLYLGFSLCRVCGKPNGCLEYIVEHWTWPEGFQHYVLEHDVRPSPDFERFIAER